MPTILNGQENRSMLLWPCVLNSWQRKTRKILEIFDNGDLVLMELGVELHLLEGCPNLTAPLLA